jgi:hypothetical protein
MVGRLHGLTHLGRQFAAVVLTFALLLQGVTLAAATGRLAANAATDAGWAAFELCHHNGSSDDGGNASAPAGAPDNSDPHCIFCLAGYALQAPLPSVAFHIIIIAIVPWTFTVWRLPALTVDASARPRGPPPTA